MENIRANWVLWFYGVVLAALALREAFILEVL